MNYIKKLWNFGIKIDGLDQYFDYKIISNDNLEILCHKLILSSKKIKHRGT